MVEDSPLLMRQAERRERVKGSDEVGGDADVEVKLEVAVIGR